MIRRIVELLTLCTLLVCSGVSASAERSIAEVELDGFVDLVWSPDTGRLLLKVDAFDSPFIYQSALARGIGSNEIGLDRGQLGATRLVRFIRSGSKVLLVQDNLGYRAQTENAGERNAVTESFARSVIWGFEVIDEARDMVAVDATDFFLRDAHGLAQTLSALEEGDYVVDQTRSAIYLPRTKAFPDNTEVEAIVTFTGATTGEYLATVAPDATSLSVHMHHSFIRLPEDGYEPLSFDPRAGVIGLQEEGRGFIDYASPIGSNMVVNFGRRHRLQKKNPAAAVSEAVDPIVYYVDRGTPEPVRSALIEGAQWWNQAFEAAGYRDAFQVRLMPEDADPMDVRYNVIQWVHRSTRGWSYGYSVLDPRSGEILKGHVSLGSLRVRQDYMIAEGLLAPYANASIPDDMLEMSLARIRQLSAHEVGHTIGFEHNFAASTQDRASVMDYPFPLIRFDTNGELDLSDAYAKGIGEWDKRTVLYAYQDFTDDVDSNAARESILKETLAAGFKYVADADSRDVGTAHPDGNLWDNGADAVAELEHLLRVRVHALRRFSDANIRIGSAEATLEEVLVPVYLLHRYQIQAVGKLIGGSYFNYSMRGDGQAAPAVVPERRQREAIAALLATLEPGVLRLPKSLVERIPPRPPGIPKSRETFSGSTGAVLDPLAPAASAVTLTLEVLLDPVRAARMNRNAAPDFAQLVDQLLANSWFKAASASDRYDDLQQQTNLLILDALMRLAIDAEADASVQADALAAIDRIYAHTQSSSPADAGMRAHLRLAAYRIERLWADPASIELLPPLIVPPGSPIGAVSGWSH